MATAQEGAAKRLDYIAQEFTNAQEKLNRNAQSRQVLGSQKVESDMVLKELETLNDDACVYKMIGPVLVKQSTNDAKANVKKRLDFIGTELERAQKLEETLTQDVMTKRQQLEEIHEGHLGKVGAGKVAN